MELTEVFVFLCFGSSRSRAALNAFEVCEFSVTGEV